MGPAVGVPGPPDDVLEWLTAPAPRDRPATSADAASTSDGDSDMMSMIVTLYKSGMVNLTMYWIFLFFTVFEKKGFLMLSIVVIFLLIKLKGLNAFD